MFVVLILCKMLLSPLSLFNGTLTNEISVAMVTKESVLHMS